MYSTPYIYLCKLATLYRTKGSSIFHLAAGFSAGDLKQDYTVDFDSGPIYEI